MIVDLFAGCGGWAEGLAMLGRTDIGLELDGDACRSRIAADHPTVRTDVAAYPADRFTGAEGLIASPPCQDFSEAGLRAGRIGDRGRLIDLVPHWVETVRPRWVACEQVPPCELIWREHAAVYRALGYSVWVGVLNAADYGVPQTRRRALLLASLDRLAHPPMPTHGRVPHASLFGPQVKPWISMAEALGWDGAVDRHQTGVATVATANPSPTLTRKAGGQWTVTTRNNLRSDGGNEFTADGPSWALTGKARSWELRGGIPRRDKPGRVHYGTVRPVVEPAPTLAFGHDSASWAFSPADTADEVVRMTPTDALILQSFRPDYPLAGTRTSQFQQIGNAVPPLLAAHVVAAITGAEV